MENLKQVNTELWNGTSWTEVTDMNTARQIGGAATNNTAGMAIGGDDLQVHLHILAATELFTGAGADVGAWSTGTNMNSRAKERSAGTTQEYSI